MIAEIERLVECVQDSLKSAKDKSAVLEIKGRYLGRTGTLQVLLGSLRGYPKVEREKMTSQAYALKLKMSGFIHEKLQKIEREQIEEQLKEKRVDISFLDHLKVKKNPTGGYHPCSIVRREIEDAFLSMGFEVLDGPHIETEYYNFEALNISKDHPARDMQDTFWLKDRKHLLRTHTSNVQVREMERRSPPFRFIAPGKVFRCERTDASHEMVFNQLEGMMVGREISVSHLIYFMKEILGNIFKTKIKVRLRPGFFPFVEPGFELDMQCLICKPSSTTCSICKGTHWLELLPCGMIHPHVLKFGGIDPQIYSGFAFGLGLDRLVMMRYGIDDIRHLQSGDLRFNNQFKSF